MNKVNTMTIYDLHWTLPMALDIISETHHMEVIPLEGDQMRVELFEIGVGSTYSLWKGVLSSRQLIQVCSWMQYIRVLAEGKDD